MHISLGLYISFDCLLSKYSYFVLSILFLIIYGLFYQFQSYKSDMANTYVFGIFDDGAATHG